MVPLSALLPPSSWPVEAPGGHIAGALPLPLSYPTTTTTMTMTSDVRKNTIATQTDERFIIFAGISTTTQCDSQRDPVGVALPREVQDSPHAVDEERVGAVLDPTQPATSQSNTAHSSNPNPNNPTSNPNRDPTPTPAWLPTDPHLSVSEDGDKDKEKNTEKDETEIPKHRTNTNTVMRREDPVKSHLREAAQRYEERVREGRVRDLSHPESAWIPTAAEAGNAKDAEEKEKEEEEDEEEGEENESTSRSNNADDDDIEDSRPVLLSVDDLREWDASESIVGERIKEEESRYSGDFESYVPEEEGKVPRAILTQEGKVPETVGNPFVATWTSPLEQVDLRPTSRRSLDLDDDDGDDEQGNDHHSHHHRNVRHHAVDQSTWTASRVDISTRLSHDDDDEFTNHRHRPCTSPRHVQDDQLEVTEVSDEEGLRQPPTTHMNHVTNLTMDATVVPSTVLSPSRLSSASSRRRSPEGMSPRSPGYDALGTEDEEVGLQMKREMSETSNAMGGGGYHHRQHNQEVSISAVAETVYSSESESTVESVVDLDDDEAHLPPWAATTSPVPRQGMLDPTTPRASGTKNVGLTAGNGPSTSLSPSLSPSPTVLAQLLVGGRRRDGDQVEVLTVATKIGEVQAMGNTRDSTTNAFGFKRKM